MLARSSFYTKLRFAPSIGILIFIGFYCYAAEQYPGGSQADSYSVGFDWMHNYWCNLTNMVSMNGQVNPARPFAITGLLVLCLSLILFFFQFSQLMVNEKSWKKIIQLSGTLSMVCAMLTFTSYHDVMTTLSSVFGVFAVLGVIRSIYKSTLQEFQISGIACIALLGLNNYIYYSQHGLYWLPLLQKLTFLVVLLWMIGVNVKMNKLKST